jgi:hypothetical protein
MHRRIGLDSRLLSRTDALIVEALRADGRLTRKELASRLSEHGVEAAGPRLAYILMHAELELLICSGGLAGKQQTYALVDERATRTPARGRDDALADLARRFFTSHGPATAGDLAWWASLRVADARRAIELAAGAVERLEVEGRTYWSGSSEPGRLTAADRRAHLLQAYDEYVIAYSESRDVVDPLGLARRASAFTHALILDGQLVGRWRRRLTGRELAVDVQLARPLAGAKRAAIDEAVDRHGRFVGVAASWSA